MFSFCWYIYFVTYLRMWNVKCFASIISQMWWVYNVSIGEGEVNGLTSQWYQPTTADKSSKATCPHPCWAAFEAAGGRSSASWRAWCGTHCVGIVHIVKGWRTCWEVWQETLVLSWSLLPSNSSSCIMTWEGQWLQCIQKQEDLGDAGKYVPS